MMSITRWDPYRDAIALQNRLNRIFSDVMTPQQDAEGFGSWLPPVDIVEESERLIVRAEVPGADVVRVPQPASAETVDPAEVNAVRRRLGFAEDQVVVPTRHLARQGGHHVIPAVEENDHAFPS